MNETVLITGASSGIGMELARLFAHDQYRLILTGQNSARLNHLAAELADTNETDTLTLTADLSTMEGIDNLIQQVQATGRDVDILVNNAGFGIHGRFIDHAADTEIAMLTLNVMAVMKLSHHFGSAMAKRGQGKILNVASIAAFQPGPWMAGYYASKSWVLSFSEGLHEELKPYGVSVSALCPGPTKTGFFERSGVDEKLLRKTPLLRTAKKVAQEGYSGLMNGEAIIIPGLPNQLTAQSSKVMPRSVVRWLTGQLNSRVARRKDTK
jgi:short-subunit dehydrogenase